MFFQRITKDISPSPSKKVESITMRIVVADCKGKVNITDMMLQSGNMAVGWVGNISEVLFVTEG